MTPSSDWFLDSPSFSPYIQVSIVLRLQVILRVFILRSVRSSVHPSFLPFRYTKFTNWCSCLEYLFSLAVGSNCLLGVMMFLLVLDDFCIDFLCRFMCFSFVSLQHIKVSSGVCHDARRSNLQPLLFIGLASRGASCRSLGYRPFPGFPSSYHIP